MPLIHETLPWFLALRKMLEAVCNDEAEMSPLTPVAAHSALLVGTKYLNSMRESEVYFIAVGKYCSSHVYVFIFKLTHSSNVSNVQAQMVL